MNCHRISAENGISTKRHTPAQRPSAEALEPRLMLSGTSYLVNSLADAVAADGVVTLREAIQAANTNLAVNEAPAGAAAEADIITFDQAALQTEAGPGNPLVITLDGSQLDITDSLDVQGLGADVLAVDADGRSRVIHVSGADTEVDLTALTITGGAVAGENGGGIYNDSSTLTLTNATVSGNSATGGRSSSGGGIHTSSGTLTLTNSTVSGNSARYGGGGVNSSDATVTLREAIQAANTNTAVTPDVPAGSATLQDVITFDQAALSAEAGVVVSLPVTITLGGSQLEITDSLDIQGLGADVLAVDADGQSRVVHVSGAYTEVDLTDLTITGGAVTDSGGGIYNDEGTMTLTNVTVLDNWAYGEAKPLVDPGGGLHFNSVDADGGGIYSQGGTVVLNNTTVAWNEASSLLVMGDDIYEDADSHGGGVANNGGTLTLNNTIVALNDALAGADIAGSSANNSSLVGGDPGFASDLRLLPTSPAIDALSLPTSLSVPEPNGLRFESLGQSDPLGSRRPR